MSNDAAEALHAAVWGSPPEQEPEPPSKSATVADLKEPAPQTAPFPYGCPPAGHKAIWIGCPLEDEGKSWKAEWIDGGPEAAPESPSVRRIWMPYIR